MTRDGGLWRSDLLAVAAAAALFATGLGSLDLWAPDEPRYAQIAEELRSLEHGARGLVLLHLNGEVYTQKPPLYFWLAALAGAPGGVVTEGLARLPSALAGIATVWLTLRLGRRLLRSRAAATWGAFVLMTTPRFAHQARRAQLDVLLAALELVAMLAFVRLEQGTGRRSRALAVFHGAMGAAVLTKGPVGLLPLAVAAVSLALDGRAREIRRLVPPWGLALSIAPGLVWILGAWALAPTGYADAAVVDNVLGRFFTGTDHVRPVWYFLYQLPLDFLPWTLLLGIAGVAALRRPRTGDPIHSGAAGPRLLGIWIAVHVVFFSISAGKRGLYLLPVFPALALLCGAVLDDLVRRPRGPGWGRRAGLAAGIVSGTAGLLIIGADGLTVWRPGPFELPPSFGIALLAIGGAVALSSRAPATPPQRMAMGIASLAVLELTFFTLALPAFDAEKSPRPIAHAAELAARAPGGRVGTIGVFEQQGLIGGIAYYSSAPVVGLFGEPALSRFVAEGGGSVVIRRRRFEELAARGRFEVRAALRGGPREVVVVRPRPVVSDPAPAPPQRQNPATSIEEEESV